MQFPEVHFSLPEGATDATIYSFVGEGKEFRLREDLMFGRGRLPDGARDLAGLVKNRLDEFRAITPGQLEIVEEVPTRFGSAAARLVEVLETPSGKPMRTLYLFAVLSDGSYLQLTYKAPPGDRQAVNRLEYIASSMLPAAQTANAAREGFTRRSVGAVTIEVPSGLKPPSHYTFSVPAGQGSLEMLVWRIGEPDPPPLLARLMAQDSALAEQTSAISQATIQVADGIADVLRYTITARDLDKVVESAVARARVQFTSGDIALLAARSGGEFRSQMEMRFGAFLQSLREK